MSIPHHWCCVPYALAQCSVAGSCTLESRSGTTTVLSSSGSGRKGEGNRFHLPADENLPLGVWPQQHVGRDKRCPVVWPVAGGPQVWSNGESCSVWCHQLPVLCIAAKSEGCVCVCVCVQHSPGCVPPGIHSKYRAFPLQEQRELLESSWFQLLEGWLG